METKTPPSANDILLNNLVPKVEPKVDLPTNTSPDAPSNAPAPVEPPKEPVTPAPVATEEFNFDNWDEPTAPEPTITKPEAVKDPKPEPTTPPVDEWVGVDEKLKKAVEFAKKGGDYLQYLGIQKVDYSKIDPVELYKTSILNHQSFSPDEAKELLESLSPLQMKERGIQLQSQYTQWQNAQVAEFEGSLRQAEQAKAERKVRADKELRSTLDKVDKIAGLSLKSHHKQDIYDAITTGRMQQELFYSKESGDYDYQSMIETYFVKKNLPKILSHVQKVTSSDTLRQHLKETSNVVLDKSKMAPEPQVETKPDVLMDFVGRSRSTGARK